MLALAHNCSALLCFTNGTKWLSKDEHFNSYKINGSKLRGLYRPKRVKKFETRITIEQSQMKELMKEGSSDS